MELEMGVKGVERKQFLHVSSKEVCKREKKVYSQISQTP